MENENTKHKVPYYRKPEDLSVEEWQTLLRKQFALQQKFKVTNIGEHAVYSDFEVYNPVSENTYKVSLRDPEKSANFCSCPDFKVNGLGTCKHIEYVLHSLLRYKKYQKIYKKPVHTSYASLSVDYGNERNIKLKKGTNKTEYPNEKEYFDENGYLKPDKFDHLKCFIDEAISIDNEFKVYQDVHDFINEKEKELHRKQIADKIFDKGIDSEVFNGLIKTDLYPYQKEGVIKLFRTGRTLLADEMGLGKTVQTIAAIELYAKFLDVNEVLIICPTSLKYQWKNEIEKFARRTVTIVEGAVHKRKDLYDKNSFYKIMSYGICRQDAELINDLKPNIVVLDEAQRIKSWKTQTAQAVKKIETDYAIVLTGTPLENRIEELHSIVEFIDQYKLGPLFKFLDKHQLIDEAGKVIGYTGLRNINKTLDDILIRRTKNEIAHQLPERIDKNFFVDMTKKQISQHNAYYDTVSRMVNKWINQGFLSEEDRNRLLLSLNCMRMVCDSTYILNQKTDFNNKVPEVIELVKELIEEGKNKIVIFSQWKKMFELIIKELDKNNLSYYYLNGDIAAEQRNHIIKKFQESDETKLFLSTDAGGVGVNLQSANILINVDIPWNPAVIEQRIARIYRLGQKKQVSVFNFVSKLSIEHKILHLLKYKKSVFQGVIEEEGEDQVLREGFMDSLKMLTEVKITEEDGTDSYSEKENNDDDIQNEKLNNEEQNEEEKLAPDNTFDKNQEKDLEPENAQSETEPEEQSTQIKTAGKKKIGIFKKVARFLSKIFK